LKVQTARENIIGVNTTASPSLVMPHNEIFIVRDSSTCFWINPISRLLPAANKAIYDPGNQIAASAF
jgi:hypothetical protein